MVKKMLRKVIFVSILCVFVLSTSGCSGQDASARVESESTGAQCDVPQVQAVEFAENQSLVNSIDDVGNSDKCSYIVMDYNFSGIGSYEPFNASDWHISLVAPGDTIEIEVTDTNRSALFLVGQTELIKYCSNDSLRMDYRNYSDASESVYGARSYRNKITISDPNQSICVFAVRDMNGGNDISGHMKITVWSSKTKEEHNIAFNNLMANIGDVLLKNPGDAALQEKYDLWDRYPDQLY